MPNVGVFTPARDTCAVQLLSLWIMYVMCVIRSAQTCKWMKTALVSAQHAQDKCCNLCILKSSEKGLLPFSRFISASITGLLVVVQSI
ncbi:hypothetical protein C0J52_01701 [Blattella germanica]|nr:hypothetical protein C0J52_01701 [Blattella germanica]